MKKNIFAAVVGLALIATGPVFAEDKAAEEAGTPTETIELFNGKILGCVRSGRYHTFR